MSTNNDTISLMVGDLVEKINRPGQGRLALVTDVSMENYYNFNSWIRIVYTDVHGGFEWVNPGGLKKLSRAPILEE